jgi:hypothetical protein
MALLLVWGQGQEESSKKEEARRLRTSGARSLFARFQMGPVIRNRRHKVTLTLFALRSARRDNMCDVGPRSVRSRARSAQGVRSESMRRPGGILAAVLTR